DRSWARIYLRTNHFERLYSMHKLPIHRLFLHLGLSSLVLLTALEATPSLATHKNSSFVLAQSTNTDGPINFTATPKLCGGQVISNGRICLSDLPADQRPAKRMAMMGSLRTDPSIFSKTITIIRVVEMEANKANLAYAAFVDDTTLPDRFHPKGFKRPLLFLSIRNDGKAALNIDYGQYPPNFDKKEEANRLLKLHKGEIQQLVSALMQKRP
ncbi:MAG: hypothetical protein VKJ24_10400, partial [Synechococcales bacterium]|nr:hypothetical protein [Synechococcales bacterium]